MLIRCGSPARGLRTAGPRLASVMDQEVRFALANPLIPYPQPPVRVSLDEIRKRRAVPMCRVSWREAWRMTSTLHFFRADLITDAGGGRHIQIPPQPRWMQLAAMFCAGVGMAVVVAGLFKALTSLRGGQWQPDFRIQDLWWLVAGGLASLAALPWLGRRKAQPVLTFFNDAGGAGIMRLEDGGSEWPVADIDRWVLVCRTDWSEDGRVGALLFVPRNAPPDQAVMVSRFSFPLDALRQVARLAAEATSRSLKETRF